MESAGPPIQGEPEALLNEWGMKLALKTDDRERIVPRHPLAGRRRQAFTVG